MKIVNKTALTRNLSFDNFEEFENYIKSLGLKTIEKSMKENKPLEVTEKPEMKTESDKIQWRINIDN